MTEFVVVTDSRSRDEVLFMVDRRKQRRSFWSNQLTDALVFTSRKAAEARAASLTFNNPRVMTLDDAKRHEAERADEEAHHAGMEASEAGWDGHKDAF